MVLVAARRLAGKAQVPGLKAKRRRLPMPVARLVQPDSTSHNHGDRHWQSNDRTFLQLLVCHVHLSTAGRVD